MNSQRHGGGLGAWPCHCGDLVAFQPKQICNSDTGIQHCQGSICVRQTRLLSGQRGLSGLILLWLLYSQDEPGHFLGQTGENRSDSFHQRPLWPSSVGGPCGQHAPRAAGARDCSGPWARAPSFNPPNNAGV